MQSHFMLLQIFSQCLYIFLASKISYTINFFLIMKSFSVVCPTFCRVIPYTYNWAVYLHDFLQAVQFLQGVQYFEDDQA